MFRGCCSYNFANKYNFIYFPGFVNITNKFRRFMKHIINVFMLASCTSLIYGCLPFTCKTVIIALWETPDKSNWYEKTLYYRYHYNTNLPIYKICYQPKTKITFTSKGLTGIKLNIPQNIMAIANLCFVKVNLYT